MKYSIIVPVYKNENTLQPLLQRLVEINASLGGQLEAVFVVDGSPDNCYSLLSAAIDELEFPAQLIAHSRNFGSFPAIRTGLIEARGEYFAVMAADLQEPPELILQFFNSLEADECDVVVGVRNSRHDPLFTRLSSNLFWGLYRRLVIRDMPSGGVDIFGCNRIFRDRLIELEESRSSLIALIFWLGFRRSTVGYERVARQRGKSSWTLAKKIEYMADSIFAFTDYPVKWMIRLGLAGSLMFVLLSILIGVYRLVGAIDVPGYTATMLAILTVGAINLLCIGLVGTYAWRAYENSKDRPISVVASKKVSDGKTSDQTIER